MPEKLNNSSENKIIKKWVIVSLCLLAGWLLLGWYNQYIYLFSSTLFIPFILCGMYLEVPNKYLIPSTYLLSITNDLIIKIIAGSKSSDFGNWFMFFNAFGFIFISFVLFSIRIIQKEEEENKEVKRVTIIKKLLCLTFTSLVLTSSYFIVIFKITYK